jgi:hypothetical protein
MLSCKDAKPIKVYLEIGDFFFCANNMRHCVGTLVFNWIQTPLNCLEVWLVKKGNNLTQKEVNVLTCIDFILVGGHVTTSTHNNPQTQFQDLPPRKHYSWCQGKRVKRHNINDHNRKKIVEAKVFNAKVLNYMNLVLPKVGKVYTRQIDVVVCMVEVSQKPSCSCLDWSSCDPKALKHNFSPCKHLYWIYNIHLQCNNDYAIHQVTLSIWEVETILNNDPLCPMN